MVKVLIWSRCWYGQDDMINFKPSRPFLPQIQEKRGTQFYSCLTGTPPARLSQPISPMRCKCTDHFATQVCPILPQLWEHEDCILKLLIQFKYGWDMRSTIAVCKNPLYVYMLYISSSRHIMRLSVYALVQQEYITILILLRWYD